MDAVVNIHFGQNIDPSGNFVKLPAGIYKIKASGAGGTVTRGSAAAPCIRVQFAVIGGESAGAQMDSDLNLPKSQVFDDSTEGKANKAAIARLKSALVCFGMSEDKAKALSGKKAFNVRESFLNKTGVIQLSYEESNGKEYNRVVWLTPEAGSVALSALGQETALSAKKAAPIDEDEEDFAEDEDESEEEEEEEEEEEVVQAKPVKAKANGTPPKGKTAPKKAPKGDFGDEFDAA